VDQPEIVAREHERGGNLPQRGGRKLALGATVQRVLHGPRRLRAFNVAMGALLALSIVLIV
jgi:hypothetical protein